MPDSIVARPGDTDCAPYYQSYIRAVPAGDLIAIARQQLPELGSLLAGLTDEQSQFRYAPDKWSIREVLGHLIDTERVFSYRATAFSRADRSALPSFDQAEWAPYGRYHERPLADLLEELTAVRHATVALMRGMPEEALARRGIASEREFTVLALLTIVPGHVEYHRQLLERDYVRALR
jgi:hypothetical protein